MQFDTPRLLLYGLVIVICGALLVGGTTSTAVFGAFNTDWDGTSELRETATTSGSEPVILRNTTQYGEYGTDDIAFVIGPTEAYDDREAERVRMFLQRGGTLVVADREGTHSHPLLASVGADARIHGSILRDERHHYRGAALPVTTEVGETEHRLVENDSSVTLNHGSSIEPNGATVLLASSRFSYLDLDDTESLSDDDIVGSQPVVTVESVGDGEVVVVSDPSLFINVMQERENNRNFTTTLVSDTDHTLVDVSHAASPPVLVTAMLTVRDSVAFSVAIGFGTIVFLGGGIRVLFRRRSPSPTYEDPATASGVGSATDTGANADAGIEPDPDKLLSGFDDEHAESETSRRLRRVTEGIIRNRSDSDDND